MKTHSVSAIILLTCCFVAAVPVVRAEEAKRSNVLFIAIDDLRPTLGCYGDPVAATPNIDRLANRGTLFHRAYCQQAVCSPSRLSLMTGRRPDTIRVWDLRAHFREAIPDVVTLPQHFKNHGYHTQSLGKPFFLAVGFRKPHLPFCAPQKYWDLYDCAQIPLSVEDKHPQDAPELATRSWKELEGYTDVPDDGQLSADKIRELRHGYYACVSYVDALVGRLLDELEKLKLAENTVVVLWGDHGYHLGEQELWTKANNYELSTRVPLLVAVPGQARTGVKSNALVELVDVYPTLADICGLDAPQGVEGISFKPLLTKPDQAWKRAVFSQYPRPRSGSRHRGHGEIMGYAVRTHGYRYVEWRDWESQQVVARELYDHDCDPHEARNVATQPEYAGAIRELAGILESGWGSVLPDTALPDTALPDTVLSDTGEKSQ